ncbi:hypothetical protein ACFL9T_00090 [Thermodesulfobacteriota bacterium]
MRSYKSIRKQVELITRELGWKHHEVEGTYIDWDKVDCPFEPVVEAFELVYIERYSPLGTPDLSCFQENGRFKG